MSATKKQHRTKAGSRSPRGPRRANDAAVYFIVAMIGAFIVLFSIPVLGGTEYWIAVLVGYLALMAWLTHLYAWRIYRGVKIAGWQQSLARIPLRFAGFGVKKGKPVEVAHDQPKAIRVILISALISLVVLAVAGYFAMRPLLETS